MNLLLNTVFFSVPPLVSPEEDDFSSNIEGVYLGEYLNCEAEAAVPWWLVPDMFDFSVSGLQAQHASVSASLSRHRSGDLSHPLSQHLPQLPQHAL